jgi:hypothetical protein
MFRPIRGSTSVTRISMHCFRAGLSHSKIQLGLVCLIGALVLQMSVATAQSGNNQTSRGNCSPNIIGGGNVTVVCPGNPGEGGNSGGAGNPRPSTSPGGPGGRWRFGVFIPTCPYGMGYSLEHQQCIPSQHLGGIIPCSQDDATFTNGRYVPNCR